MRHVQVGASKIKGAGICFTHAAARMAMACFGVKAGGARVTGVATVYHPLLPWLDMYDGLKSDARLCELQVGGSAACLLICMMVLCDDCLMV